MTPLMILLQAGVSLGVFGKAIGAAVAAFAAAFGIGKIGSSSLEAGARQPEQAGHYRMTAIIVSALIEGACLFAIVVCLIAK
ncbi:MAG: ATP synthase F0 subunit C [Bacteroidales bacterium]|nr:ATP synthase F0 subunit C [Bacteroidales bacterium]